MFHHIMVNLTGSSHKKCHLLLVKCCAFPLASQGRGLEHGRFEQGFSETGLFMMVNVYVHKYIYIYIHTYTHTIYICGDFLYIYMPFSGVCAHLRNLDKHWEQVNGLVEPWGQWPTLGIGYWLVNNNGKMVVHMWLI